MPRSMVRSFALHPLPSPHPRSAQDDERALKGVGEPVRVWAVRWRDEANSSTMKGQIDATEVP
jgi:hypothetical protein